MASSLASLKQLPCPAGNNCTAFQCLFKHERDGAKQGPIDTARRPQPVKQDATSEDSEGPRKRPKLSQSASPGSLHDTALSGLEGRGKSARGNILSKTDPVDASTSKITPAKRPISPPPLKRDVQSSSKQAERSATSLAQTKTQTSTTQATSSTSASTTKSPVPAKSPAKTALKKPETLNPRLLKRSPAQHDMRLKLLKALHEEYTRLNNELKKDPNSKGSNLVLSDQELIVRALDEEQETATKKPTVYPNSMKNRIFTYKRMSIAQWKEERTKALQEASTQAGKEEPDLSKPIVTGLTAPQEVEFVKRLVWHLNGLERFGYVTSMPSEEDIRSARQAVEASGNTETCDRCTRRFQVFPGRRQEDGALATNGSCTYHPGKLYYGDRPPGDRSQGQRKYRCCHQNVEDKESAGCTTSNTHVFKTTDPKRLASILNFAETPPNPDVPADRAIAFDCEMGYTVYGLELIRLTAVSWPSGEELLDVLVQPVGETLDLNTRYSGVRPEDMVNAERWKPGDDPTPAIIPSSDPSQPPKRKLKLVPSPKAARDLLFSLMNPETPLIGHGTENDLNAIRIIHPTVVDTVLLYPHKRGLPVRNGLKYLTEAHLGRKIQLDLADEDGVPEGHDSAEDARAAGELVRLKVRDEWRKMQLKGWKLSDKGEFLAPGEDGWTYVGAGKKTGS
ncbi:hypothetical protein DL770_007941 [Monosporascus sp. CRB-9-2]|nr:hypothetical protein DL770_007941 [Monosporascus sp. CRB-9-2]